MERPAAIKRTSWRGANGGPDAQTTGPGTGGTSRPSGAWHGPPSRRGPSVGCGAGGQSAAGRPNDRQAAAQRTGPRGPATA